MSQFLVSFIAFIVAISILVTVHEFGHFWVARRNGVRVLRFSIGFGKPLYRWYDKLGTEFVISSIPLGGYISLLGEKAIDIQESDKPLAFSYKSPWTRISILVAGPLFNLIFAVVAFWIIYLMGITVSLPILGAIPKNSPAEVAGLKKGQEIIAIEKIETTTWEEVANNLLQHIGENEVVTVDVRDTNLSMPKTMLSETVPQAAISLPANISHQKKLDLSRWEEGNKGDILDGLGLEPYDPVPPLIAKLVPDHPAEKAGFKEGDKILTIDNKPVDSRTDAINTIQKQAEKNITIEILRDNQKLIISVIPITKVSNEGIVGIIGVEFPKLKEMPPELIRKENFGIFKSLALAFQKTYSYSVLTLQVLKKMILGQLSARHISGPISIAKYAGQTANLGIQQFLNFMALISISLGILNLVPVPLLDGGHILYCLIEIISGKPLPLEMQNAGFWLGGFLLICFMLLAFYNDFLMLLH